MPSLFSCLCPSPPELPGYKVVKRLGAGACGFVYLAEDEHAAAHRVALKCLPAPAGKNPPPLWALEATAREVQALAAVGWGHVNLIRPLELMLTSEYLALALRYCRGGTLEAYCRSRTVSEDMACYMLHQLVSVVEYLHHRNIAYRDLKLENVLLDKPTHLFGLGPPPRLVLADFGCAKRFKRGEAPITATFLGTPGFMAPQVLAAMANKSVSAAMAVAADGAQPAAASAPGSRGTSQHSSSGATTDRVFDAFKADSWALGALLHYMLFGELPYGYDSFAPLLPPQDALLTLLQLEHSHTWQEAAGSGHHCTRRISKEAADLLDQLLHPGEEDRLSIEGIRNHPWFKRQLPSRYAAALADMQEQQAVLNAAAANSDAKDCRRLVSHAVQKLFKLAQDPAVLASLRPQHPHERPRSLCVPLMCLGSGVQLARAAQAANSSGISRAWSLEAALAASVVAQQGSAAQGCSSKQHPRQQKQHLMGAATASTGSVACETGSSRDLVKQHLLQVIATLDQAGAAVLTNPAATAAAAGRAPASCC